MAKTTLVRVNNRVQSVDIIRGFIMVIMALDHARDFFSYTTYRATDLTQASVFLFFTRWVTHICAPTFVFLSGISIFFYAKKVGSLKKTTLFLLSRGIWLIVVEVLIISFILTQGYQMTLLTVIWAIACSMILLAGLIWLPRSLQILISLAMIFAHDALPAVGPVTNDNLVAAFLHNMPFFINAPPILVAYTIVPWVGVMLLGYIIGTWFADDPKASELKKSDPKKRDGLLLRTGALALMIFLILRFLNVYGDPSPWAPQERGSTYTLLSFLNISKSPPSLLFLCLTLGTSLILLGIADRLPGGLKRIFMTYGRVPFFYFILHLAIISLASYIWTYLSFGEPVNLSFVPVKEWPPAYRPSLMRAYIVWVFIVAVLYYPCRWFGRYKSRNKSWWVSYL